MYTELNQSDTNIFITSAMLVAFTLYLKRGSPGDTHEARRYRTRIGSKVFQCSEIRPEEIAHSFLIILWLSKNLHL